MRLLEVKDVVKSYGRRCVVNRVNFHLEEGEIVGLLGPNGAGKTTSFLMTVGRVRPDSGEVRFKGRDVTRTPMYKRARLGLGYLSQERSDFQRLTVEENILAILETQPLNRRERQDRLEELLRELDLVNLRKNRAYTLSGGERRRLEITRALASNPDLILLDEPFAGVDPIAVAETQEIVRSLKERNISVLLTDHNVRETLSITDRSYIIAEGRIIQHGKPRDLINDPTVRKVYLGEKFSMYETPDSISEEVQLLDDAPAALSEEPPAPAKPKQDAKPAKNTKSDAEKDAKPTKPDDEPVRESEGIDIGEVSPRESSDDDAPTGDSPLYRQLQDEALREESSPPPDPPAKRPKKKPPKKRRDK